MKDALSGTWFGHPLHPVLVMVPIGSWTSASVLDVHRRALLPGRPGGWSASGVVAALPSAVSGLADWSDTEGSRAAGGGDPRHLELGRLGPVCGLLVGPAAGGQGAGGGAVLALAGMAVATGAGYLGGHLIYAQGVGVDTNAFQSGPRTGRRWRPSTTSPTGRR